MTPEPGKLTVSKLPANLQVRAWPGAVALHRALRERLALPVDLVLTNNRQAMVSVRRAAGRCRLRLHHMFTQADPKTIDALAALASQSPGEKKRARKRLQTFIEDHEEAIKPRKARRKVHLRPVGLHHDLSKRLKAVLESCFEGQERRFLQDVHITWGRRRTASAPQRQIRLGSYDIERNIIRIHPTLDARQVGSWVLDFIIFHELLHKLIPSRRSGGRFIHHSPHFRSREKTHADYERFQQWKQRSLSALVGQDSAAAKPSGS